MDERFTYFALLLGWAFPPIVLQWVAGWRWLNQHRRVWLLGILIPTVWLVLADATALGVVWTITPSKSTGIFLGNVPIEEVLFFILTNTLVVQSFLLIYHASELAIYWRENYARFRAFTNRSNIQPAHKPVKQVANQSTSKPASKPASNTASNTATKPANKPANKPVNKRKKKPRK